MVLTIYERYSRRAVPGSVMLSLKSPELVATLLPCQMPRTLSATLPEIGKLSKNTQGRTAPGKGP